MKKLIFFLVILLFSFTVKSKPIEKNSSAVEIEQPKYQILPQDKTFLQLFSRWAALENNKIQYHSFFDKKLRATDLRFNNKFKKVKDFEEAIVIFVENFEGYRLNETFIYKMAEIDGKRILVVYDRPHHLCLKLESSAGEKDFEKNTGYNYDELYSFCKNNNLLTTTTIKN